LHRIPIAKQRNIPNSISFDKLALGVKNIISRYAPNAFVYRLSSRCELEKTMDNGQSALIE